MKRLAIIPARGGSKRIPRKNVKDFLGKPIIAYSIESALESGLFDEVMVSTDDIEIAELSKSLGATIPFMRSHKNSDDFATTVDVIKEVVSFYEERGSFYDFICCIYPTAPFVGKEVLEDAFEKLIKGSYDTVFPVLEYSFPVQRAIRLNDESRIEMLYPQFLNSRSQDLEKSYHDAGQFYFFKKSVVTSEEPKGLWTDNTGVLVISEMDAHDIDNPIDWEVAEFKYKLRYE